MDAKNSDLEGVTPDDAPKAEDIAKEYQSRDEALKYAACDLTQRIPNKTVHGFDNESLKRGILSLDLCNAAGVTTRKECRFLLCRNGMRYCGFDDETTTCDDEIQSID